MRHNIPPLQPPVGVYFCKVHALKQDIGWHPAKLAGQIKQNYQVKFHTFQFPPWLTMSKHDRGRWSSVTWVTCCVSSSNAVRHIPHWWSAQQELAAQPQRDVAAQMWWCGFVPGTDSQGLEGPGSAAESSVSVAVATNHESWARGDSQEPCASLP